MSDAKLEPIATTDEVLAEHLDEIAADEEIGVGTQEILLGAAKRLRELAADAKRIDQLEALVKAHSIDLSYGEDGDEKGFSLGLWDDDGWLDDRDLYYDTLREALDDAATLEQKAKGSTGG